MSNTHTSERLIQGRSVGSGVVMGKTVLLNAKSRKVAPETIEEKAAKSHVSRFRKARKQLVGELDKMVRDFPDSSTADIIDTQKQIIEDVEIEKNVIRIIEEKRLNVGYAIYKTYCNYIEKLQESGSELFRQRIVDLEDIRDRFVAKVSKDKRIKTVKKGSIIVTSDISPTDLVSYYEDGAVGLIMEKGGVTSHAAIIAKSLGMPCLVNADHITRYVSDQDTVILDADQGTVLLFPSQETIDKHKETQKSKSRRSRPHKKLKFETADGYTYQLLANIEFEAEVNNVKDFGASGIGLLRTESLLFGNYIRNSREDQQAFYEKILNEVEGDVTIRLFDIGGDKTGGHAIKEPNPFLGWRGIRLLLDEQDLLIGQLRALLTSAGKFPGRVRILLPMVSMVHEVAELKKVIKKVQNQLKDEGTPIDRSIQLGLMVEVPSVAIQAGKFAKMVDFLSIGTNDLTQYTLAVDRGNDRIGKLFQHYDPSVLKLIKMTADAAGTAETDISVCGELAGDEVGAACLMGFGITRLSMIPQSIPVVNELLNKYSMDAFRGFAKSVLEQNSAEEVEALFRVHFPL